MCWQFYINCRATLACLACFVDMTSIRAVCFRFSVRRRIVSLESPSKSDAGEICIVDHAGRDMHGHKGPRLRGGGDEGHRVHARRARLYAGHSLGH